MHYLAVSIVPRTSLAPINNRTGRMMTNFVFCIYTEKITHICAHESRHFGSRNDLLPVCGCAIPGIIASTIYFLSTCIIFYQTLVQHIQTETKWPHFTDDFFKCIFFNMFFVFNTFLDNNIADDTENLCISHTHYHDYWWLSGITSQGINNHIIDPFYPEYSCSHTE